MSAQSREHRRRGERPRRQRERRGQIVERSGRGGHLAGGSQLVERRRCTQRRDGLHVLLVAPRTARSCRPSAAGRQRNRPPPHHGSKSGTGGSGSGPFDDGSFDAVVPPPAPPAAAATPVGTYTTTGSPGRSGSRRERRLIRSIVRAFTS